jgi:mono/diheme cytochrome c family protein
MTAVKADSSVMEKLLFSTVLLLGICGAANADEKAADKPLDVKNTFRNICGFCHSDYGRKEGKGPQLMNSKRSDEFLINRITHGMPGRMAAFGSVFTQSQIRDIVKFIRSLKPDEEPQNPT